MKWTKRDSCKTIREVFLRNIGAKNINEVNNWFIRSRAEEYRLDNVETASSLIKCFIDKPVTIVGDYDADGICASSIMWLALQYLGFKDVKVRIPKRFSEGYGLSQKIIDEIDSGLVITVDNGITAIDEIKNAKDKGLTVVVTDHHLSESGGTLPEADIIIDPKALSGSADFDGYCGAGIAYKIACQLLNEHENKDKLKKTLLPFAGIATITDVMPLREENYVFVKDSLQKLIDQRYLTTGLYALICALNLSRHVSSKDIGFKIGPSINAASRMKDDGADDVLKLLTFNGPYEDAVSMAETLVSVNEARKDAKKTGLEKAHKVIEEDCLFGDVPLIVNVPDIQPGIIGIIAGALTEEFKVPAFVLSGSKILKGSARTFGDYNIKRELDKVSGLLEGYGGHVGAAGLSVSEEKFEELKTSLQKNFTDEEYNLTSPEEDEAIFDLEINAKDIGKAAKEVLSYEPFGEGNPEIRFKIDNFVALPKYGDYYKTMGNGTVVKLSSANASAIGFGLADRFNNPKKSKDLDLIGVLSENYFGGTKEAQIEFSDFIQKKPESIETPLAKKLRELSIS